MRFSLSIAVYPSKNLFVCPDIALCISTCDNFIFLFKHFLATRELGVLFCELLTINIFDNISDTMDEKITGQAKVAALVQRSSRNSKDQKTQCCLQHQKLLYKLSIWMIFNVKFFSSNFLYYRNIIKKDYVLQLCSCRTSTTTKVWD